MKKLNKTIQAKSAKIKIAEAKVRIAQRKLAEAKKALKEAETQIVNGYPIEELGKGRFIDLSESVVELDECIFAVQLPAESKYAGKYFVYGIVYDDCDDDEYDIDAWPWTAKAYITDSIPEKIGIGDIDWGFARGEELDEVDGKGQDEVVFEIDEDTNEYFVGDPCRSDTNGLYFGKDAYRFGNNVNRVSFGIEPDLDDDDED